MKALPYANMEQATYPPPVELSGDNLAVTARKEAEILTQAPYQTDLIAYMQRGTLGALPESV